MSGVKVLAILVLLLTTGLAGGQCGTLEEAHAAIIELARVEMQVFHGVSFDWRSVRVSTYGEALVVGIPVIEPPEGFHPGDIVAGFVIRGYPERPDGAYGLQLEDGLSVKLVNAWGEVFRVIPLCDPRLGDCDPVVPGIDALSIARFHPAAEENCCVDCYEFCHGYPPNRKCEWECSIYCPCAGHVP
jgi:hypothetical protein